MLNFFIILTISGIYIFKNYQFKQGSYYKLTHNSFLSTILNTGRNGEYQIYKRLFHYESTGGKFLFNCYLPKDNGETTEIDVLLNIQRAFLYLKVKTTVDGFLGMKM